MQKRLNSINWLRTLALATVLLTMVACVKGVKTDDEVDPYQMTRDEFRMRVDVMAVVRATIPDGLPDAAMVTMQIDSLINVELGGSGYTVLWPQDYEAEWAAAVATEGPIHEASGALSAPAVARSMDATFRAVGESFRFDAIVIPRVEVVEAAFASGRAQWDGTTQAIKTGSPVEGFLAGSPDGILPALSLIVTVYDRDGTVLYERKGGIEVLSKMTGNDFVQVPRDELFTDRKRIQEAVAIAIEPLERR